MIGSIGYYVLDDIRTKVEQAVSSNVKGVSMPSFYRQVTEGNIRKHPEDQNKRKGIRYSAEDVDSFLLGSTRISRRQRETAPQETVTIITPDVLRYQIDLAHKDDVASIFFLENRLDPDRAINPILLGSWVKKNRNLYWILFNPQNRNQVWAVLGIIPVRDELIQRLINYEISPNDISLDDIQTYELGQSYSCFITSVTAESMRKDLIVPLAHKFFSTMSELPIQIDKIYALGPDTPYETPLTRLVSECFFLPFREDEAGTIWRLRLDRPNPASFIRDYARSVSQKKGHESMIAILEKISPNASVKDVKNRIGLQRRYSLDDEGYLAPDVRFRRAETYEDVLAIVQINNALFGKSKDIPDKEIVRHRLSWLEQNPDVIYVLEVRKKIVGFVSILPLPSEVMQGVLRSTIRMSQINADDIQRYQPGRPFDLFVWTVGIDKDIQGQTKKWYGNYLIMGIWHLFNEWGNRGIQIRSVNARSDELEGINISHVLGLHSVPPPTGVEKAVFDLHPLDEEDHPFLVQYQRNLELYNVRHGIGASA